MHPIAPHHVPAKVLKWKDLNVLAMHGQHKLPDILRSLCVIKLLMLSSKITGWVLLARLHTSQYPVGGGISLMLITRICRLNADGHSVCPERIPAVAFLIPHARRGEVIAVGVAWEPSYSGADCSLRCVGPLLAHLRSHRRRRRRLLIECIPVAGLAQPTVDGCDNLTHAGNPSLRSAAPYGASPAAVGAWNGALDRHG
jgi:hypothetical protein